MGSITQPSAFNKAEFIAPDGIFDVTKRYLADTDPKKVNLGQGTYRDENGKPWLLPSVRMAKETIVGADHEYLPLAGLKTFRDGAVDLVFHDTKMLAEDRIASVQGLSGTGSLLLAGMALKKANTGIKKVYITDPTWSNHDLMFDAMGFEVRKLPYYKDRAFDFQGYMDVLGTADSSSAVVLHACAHNPTGCDPSREQWRQIAAVVRARGVFPIFDSAYLGFNSGSVDEDAWAIRHFTGDLGLEAAVCMSFAKSMGLYGERVGLVAFVLGGAGAARTVDSILQNAQRSTVSTPPVYGARIAAAVLGTPEIKEQWARDLLTMSGRILSMRRRLYDELVRLQTPGDWTHIVKQSGMFGYTGISTAQVEYLEEKFHVYMANTSRISMAGLNEGNVEYFAKSLDETVRTVA